MNTGVTITIEPGDTITGSAMPAKQMAFSDGTPLHCPAQVRVAIGHDLLLWVRSPAKLREVAALAARLADELDVHLRGGE